MRFLILGRFEVERDGAVLDLGARLQRAVLACLVLHSGRMVSAERLTEDLWGAEQPAKALASLQVYVANLRRVLEPEREARAPATVLRTQPPGYLLDLSGHQLDAVEFEQLAAACRAHLAAPQPEEARRAADAALALWRGPVLEDLSDLRFVQDESARLDALRVAVVEARLQAFLESGEHAAVIGELRGLTTRHPLRERGWELLMLALYRAGRVAEALDAYREAAAVLRDELGLDPGQDLRDLHERMLRRDPALEPQAAATLAVVNDPVKPVVAPSLPPDPDTPLIGRAHDVDAIIELLGTTRVVTIVGPGGVGKTRLALRAAHVVAEQYPDGVVFVDLVGVRDPRLVLATVTRALGVRESTQHEAAIETVIRAIGDRRILVVLDNVDHVLAAASDVAALLERAPRVTVLATSREALRIRDERRYPLKPLEVPQLDHVPTAGEVATAAAAQLFVDRAEASGGVFALSNDNASAVAAICRRLDGIPLALELAASWLRILSPTDLLARLDDALPLLSHGPRDLPERQRTMRQAVAWSYDLLDHDQQRLLQRLAVFRGGWMLDDAEAVAIDEPGSALVAHMALFEKSLIRRSTSPANGGSPELRFRMFEPVRDFALERLASTGGTAAVRDSHSARFVEQAERMASKLEGPEQARALEWGSRELGNIRAAMEWLLASGRLEDAVRLVWALRWYWYITGTLREPLQWIRTVLTSDHRLVSDARARARVLEGFLLYTLGEWELAEQALDQAGQVDDAVLSGFALQIRAQVVLGRGDFDATFAMAREAVDRHRSLKDPVGEGLALLSMAHADLARGRYEAVPDRLARAELLLRGAGAPWMIAYANNMHVSLAEAQGRVVDEADRIRESIRLCHRIGDRIALTFCLSSMAGVRLATGHGADSARLIGAVETLRERSGLVFVNEVTRVQVKRDVTRARELLGDAAFAQHRREGRAMTVDQVVELALAAGEGERQRAGGRGSAGEGERQRGA